MEEIVKRHWSAFTDAFVEIVNGKKINCDMLDFYCEVTNTTPDDPLAKSWVAFICGINAGLELAECKTKPEKK